MPLHPVRRFVILRGGHIPKQVAVLRGVRTQMLVQSPGKDHARNGGHRGRLRGTASRRVTAARMRRPPGDFASVQLQRKKPPADFRIQLRREAESRIARSFGNENNRRQGSSGALPAWMSSSSRACCSGDDSGQSAASSRASTEWFEGCAGRTQVSMINPGDVTSSFPRRRWIWESSCARPCSRRPTR